MWAELIYPRSHKEKKLNPHILSSSPVVYTKLLLEYQQNAFDAITAAPSLSKKKKGVRKNWSQEQ